MEKVFRNRKSTTETRCTTIIRVGLLVKLVVLCPFTSVPRRLIFFRGKFLPSPPPPKYSERVPSNIRDCMGAYFTSPMDVFV